MEPDVSKDDLERQIKVDQLLEALRTSRLLTPDAESALIFRPDSTE